MKSKRTLLVTRVALSASLMVALALVSGCGRDGGKVVESTDTQGTDAPEVYMKDPVFLKQLDAQKRTRNSILANRCRIEEAIAAEKAKNTASEKIKELEAELVAADEAFESNRLETAAIVRERLTRKKGMNK